MAERETVHLDWFEAVLSVLSPALIMGLVGGLTFFLLAVGYRGEFIGQMKWTLFFFVVGAVLVARICLLMGNEYGALYGLLLGGATFAATIKYVEVLGMFFSFLLILVITGSAYLLTRDCTWMETPDRIAQQGIAAELNSMWQLFPAPDQPGRKRRHGLSVIWFSLAALPIFGIGQSLIPIEDQIRRASAFWYMTVYIGCALGLLLTTALVSLRAYLKVRKLKMPPTMTAMWIGTGMLIIVATLVIGAVIPRPQNEVITWNAFGSSKRDASKVSPNADKGGQGEGQPGADGDKIDQTKDGNQRRGAHDDQSQQKYQLGKKGSSGDKQSEKGESQGEKKDPNGEPARTSPPPSRLDAVGGFVQSILKWIVIIFVVLLILFVAVRGLAGLSERFRKWLEQFKQRPRGMEKKNESESDLPEIIQAPRPLSEFVSPFADGSAERRSDSDLVRYSFAALEAWAVDRGRARRLDETPMEFAEVAAELDAELEVPANRLVHHLSRLEYSAFHRASGNLRPDLKTLWDAMMVEKAESSKAN